MKLTAADLHEIKKAKLEVDAHDGKESGYVEDDHLNCVMHQHADALIEAAEIALKAAGDAKQNDGPGSNAPRPQLPASPAVLDWADVLAFFKRTFPDHVKNWGTMTDAEMMTIIEDSWGEGPFYFPVDGKGNWWSRVVQPAYERQDRLAKALAALKYAKTLVENYAMDIRHRKDLVDAGFCQGKVYTEAMADIARIEREGMPQ